uniref:Uncharacterized protein n=1 Tax=Glossina pallidipes TaxID=7398 RepID=A0A1A9Z327_GLOPL
MFFMKSVDQSADITILVGIKAHSLIGCFVVRTLIIVLLLNSTLTATKACKLCMQSPLNDIKTTLGALSREKNQVLNAYRVNLPIHRQMEGSIHRAPCFRHSSICNGSYKVGHSSAASVLHKMNP